MGQGHRDGQGSVLGQRAGHGLGFDSPRKGIALGEASG